MMASNSNVDDSKVLPEIEKPSASEQIPDDELGEEVSLAVTEYQDGTKAEKLPYQTSHDKQNVSRQDVNGNLDKDDSRSLGEMDNQDSGAETTSCKGGGNPESEEKATKPDDEEPDDDEQNEEPKGQAMGTNDNEEDEKPDNTEDTSQGQRAKDDAKKVAEFSDYIQRMEARLATLETKMGIKGSEDGTANKADDKRIPAIPELRRVTWAGFKNQIKGNKKIYAVEALVGGVKYYYQRNKQQTQEILSSSDGVESTSETLQTVDRIRINSTPIMMTLADISDQELSLEPTVFIQPFKFLAHHNRGIRNRLAVLESKWSAREKEDTSPIQSDDSADGNKEKAVLNLPTESKPFVSQADTSSQSPSNTDKQQDDGWTDKHDNPKRTASEDLVDSVEALKDLRCLVQFMDQELRDIDRFSKVDPPSRILFKDLWHLFKPGDQVFAPLQSTTSEDQGKEKKSPHVSRLQRYQVSWRVLSTWGGRPNLSAGDDEEINLVPKQKINPFEVNCYYIDFTGETFVPAAFIFKIKPFPGEREITSLEVYPWRYLKDREKIRDSLKDRGEKFREFLNFQYRFYKGPTMVCQPDGYGFTGNSFPVYPEQIESEVIIDFRQAIQENPDRTPYWGFAKRTTGYNDRETDDSLLVSIWKDEKQEELDDEKFDLIYDDSLIDADLTVNFENKDPFLKEDPDRSFKNGKSFREEDLILLPARVLAYVFRKQRFAALNIDNLQPVGKPYSKGWKDLKLPKGHKAMLRALVKNHLSDKESRTPQVGQDHAHDIVRGKGWMPNRIFELEVAKLIGKPGQGLVVLLHGVPGVGKTSTAECVAESHNKPLLRITCGDLGLTAESVEKELDNKFHLASTWDCVLLLDEADVFLAQRTRKDLQRNALVSVFLRVLEYYTGILFLTTNRVGAFDDAFKSRIHLPLYYPPLDQRQTRSIWEMNLKRTLEYRSSLIADEEAIMSYADRHFRLGGDHDVAWNGRQIRNAFQTATALAEFEAREQHSKDVKNGKKNLSAPTHSKLQSKHFNVVAQASFDFDKYLDSIDDETLAGRAHRASERNDKFLRTNIMRNTLEQGQEQADSETRVIGRGRPEAGHRQQSTRFREPPAISHSVSDPRISQQTIYRPTQQTRYMEPEIPFYTERIPQEQFSEQVQRQAHISAQQLAGLREGRQQLGVDYGSSSESNDSDQD